MSKKFIIINRDKCIGCGACVAASDDKAKFIQGKAWFDEVTFDNSDEIISLCPVDAIDDTDSLEEYLKIKNSYQI